LAKAFDLNEAVLKAEFHKLYDVAKYNFVHKSLTNIEAWKAALEATADQRRRCNGIAYPVTQLRPVLMKYASWLVSTSGVEQTLNLRDFIDPSRRGAGPQIELDHLTIVAHRHPKEEEEIFAAAQVVWTKLYGACRESNSRLKGAKRKKVEQDPGAGEPIPVNQWVKRRRDESITAAQQEGMATSVQTKERAGQIAGDLWTAKHAQVEQEQVAKRSVRFLEAVRSGHALEDEINAVPNCRAMVQALTDHEDNLRTKRNKTEDKRKAILGLRQPDNLEGLTVHIWGMMLTEADAGTYLRKFRMRRAVSLRSCNVCIVPDVVVPPVSCALHCMLHGGRLATKAYLMSGGVAWHRLA
jgi:hypothetical protein